jgi:hypothetical protein
MHSDPAFPGVQSPLKVPPPSDGGNEGQLIEAQYGTAEVHPPFGPH